MNNTMIDTKAVILALQRVKDEKDLSIDAICKLVEDKDPSCAVSRTTIARVFRKGAEEQVFKWEASLRPIANALLDIEEIENEDNTDTQAYKAILKLKKDLLDNYEQKFKEQEAKVSAEKEKYHDKLEKELSKYQKSLDFAMQQIELKDKRIDMLMEANERLSITNNKLLNQFLNCPLKNKECD